MLEVPQKTLLLSALKAPLGMELQAAVGTTFTLNLAALLSVPVSQSFEGDNQEESAFLLEQIRRYSERTVLFCQAGEISIPAKYRAALAFVEQTVVEVKKPEGGLFHPKVWVVRFGDGRRTTHRVLVMSRNLTFDRAWDVLVRLDELDDAALEGIDATPLIDFLTHVRQEVARPLSNEQTRLLDSLQESVSGVKFAVPEPFSSGELLPLWRGSSGRPFDDGCEHALAISPFLTADAASSFLGTATKWSGVISRRSALDGAQPALRNTNDVLRVKDLLLDADRDLGNGGDAEPAVGEQHDDPVESPGALASLRGLHAKVYLQDSGGMTNTWLGSANLTGAAFSTNTEFLVRLAGTTRQVGYDRLLPPDRDRGSIADIVEDHEFSDVAGEEEPEDGITALDNLICDLASRQVRVALTPTDHGYTADLAVELADGPPDIGLSAALLTLRGDRKRLVGGEASWTGLAASHITPFVLLDVSTSVGSKVVLVRAELIGDDPTRRGDVLALAIANRDDFMRYLTALLGGEPAFTTGGGKDGERRFRGWGNALRLDRLMEDLLSTASRHPDRLASLENTLASLERLHPGVDIVPPDFRELWDAVHASRVEVRK